ncbi:TonB-dependent receptor [uncultured Sphingomonas sp.]|uniref:TonB-dependent receptor n=1 Tax=uncultured Sphingomonas sp. TaxID=158754 RepID=UPI0035CB66B4
MLGTSAPAVAQAQVRADAQGEAGTGKTTPPATDDQTGNQRDIIVTAGKREERITDVPFAITAIGQAEIQDRGSIDIKDLQYSIPGLNIQELSPGANKTTLRGINPGAGTGLPIVGIYVDEVGVTVDQQQRDPTFPLVDIARIEVLRGPQGTLFGEGSIAGTIRYITRDPSLTQIGGFVEAKASTVEHGSNGYGIDGAIGVPLVTDRVGLRVSGGYDRLPGWIDYPAAGVEDANKQRRVFIRPKLLAQLDRLRISLLYQYYDQKSDTDGISGTADRYTRPGRTSLYPASDTSHLVNGILSYDFGPGTLLSSSSYQTRGLTFSAPFTPFLAVFSTRYHQFSQELRVSSNGDGPVKYVGGVFYRNYTSAIDRTFFLNGIASAVARRVGTDPVNSNSFAAFGDLTVRLAPRLDLSGGLRYYYDRRSTSSTIPATTTNQADFRALSPRGSIRYGWTDDISTYATVSKGFRSGGFNGSGTSFGPESLWNYEIGTKASLFGGRLFFDVAGFHVDYSDRQANGLVAVAPNVFLTETRNVGKASGNGVEGSITARLGGGFEIGGTAAYNDIKSDVTNAEVVRGQRFDFVPAFTGSAFASARVPLGERLYGMARVDYQHSSPYASITRQGQPNGTVVTLENFRNERQDYLNLRVGVEVGAVGFYLDARNILNEDTILFPNSPIAVNKEGTRPQPRTFQATLRWNFDR